MKIWLESVDLALIEKGVKQGLLQGVVTTPSLLLQNPKELLAKLVAAQPGPVVVDVYSDFEKNGRMVTALSPQIVVRLPAVQEAWEAIHTLSKQKVPVMVGAIFSPVHALLAARTGAPYIAPHLSRMLKTGDRPFEQLEATQKIVTNYKFATDVMVLHPKSLEQVKACAEMGAAGIVVREDLYKELLDSHELAAFHVEQWIAEGEKSIALLSSS